MGGRMLKVMTGGCCFANAVDDLKLTLSDSDPSGDFPAARIEGPDVTVAPGSATTRVGDSYCCCYCCCSDP